jgi:signal transduction histidine kinase
MRQWMAVWHRTGDVPAARRDADMMALTVCLVLLAALTAGNDHEPHSKWDVLSIVWATTVGLVLTHCFALLLAARLVRDPAYTVDLGTVLAIQLAIALVIALATTVVVLTAEGDFDRFGARASAAVFLGLIVGAESRRGGSSRSLAALWGVVAAATGLIIAAAKWVVTA